MAIYSKKIKSHPEWLKAFKRYESLCGFEPMYQDQVDSGEMTEHEAWHMNVRWLEDVTGDVLNTTIPWEE